MTNQDKPSFISDFKKRVAENRPSRWVRFSIVSVIFFLWVLWLGNWWVALAWFLLFDIYITGYIPFTWWKKSKNAAVRTVMGWVDAIVYALILVYFVFLFIGQNYQIPSSSLEKSLLVGDYLWVNKMAYGPRVPNTPIHFPLVQNTLPIINTKSYLETPQWTYHRLKGLGSVKRGDIVVFNFPAGDTVALKVQNPDYYTLSKMFGRDAVWSNPEKFGKVIYRPVDRRENYVKRAVGLPGDTLKVVDDEVWVNGKKEPWPENAQLSYYLQPTRAYMTDADWENLGVAVDDRREEQFPVEYISLLVDKGFKVNPDGTMPPIYYVPMTRSMVEKAKQDTGIGTMVRVDQIPLYQAPLYPDGAEQRWTPSNYGPLWIPKKGTAVKLNKAAWDRYGRVIRVYEGNTDAYFNPADGKVYIGGRPQDSYRFKMDYYFMMGDNRDNSLDSRFWGFVPEDHIVGRPEFVLVSFDKDRGLFNGGIRWNRVFTSAHK